MVRHQIFLNVQNFTLSNRYINRVVDDQLKKRKAQDTVVEIEVVGIRRMKALNEKYMGKKSATDVLSFSLNRIPGEKIKNAGTIVICNDIIKLQAKSNELGFEGEFSKMLRHGVDHLLGLHHK